VVDAYTIKLNLKRPDAALLATLTDSRGHDGLAQGRAGARSELERNAKARAPARSSSSSG